MVILSSLCSTLFTLITFKSLVKFLGANKVVVVVVVVGFVIIWLKYLAPLYQQIRSNTKTNRDLLARVYLRLVPDTCICSDF